MDLFKKVCALFKCNAMGFKAKHTIIQQLRPGKESSNKLRNKVKDNAEHFFVSISFLTAQLITSYTKIGGFSPVELFKRRRN